ncbi:MAG: HD domain-containing phosphohydrolase, partial [Candidatus Aminicenantales bacterium]
MKIKKILIVESNNHRRKKLAGHLANLDFDIKEASSLSEADQYLIAPDNFSLLLLSLSRFNEPQLKKLRLFRRANPKMGLILLSRLQNPKLALSLLDKGLVDYIASPQNPAAIYSAIKNEFQKRELIKENQLFKRSLDRLHLKQQKNHQKASNLEEIYDATLENLMTALDLRDVETFGHSKTVAKYSLVLAEILGIDDEERLDNIKKGALLHDVGKIAIPDSILKKPSSLSPQEWKKIKLHPALGFGLIRDINLLKEVGNIILYHHERYDGQGYPRQLKGKRIPLEARIFALADALDAITSHRPYRKERDFREARQEIEDNSGSQFDPQAVEAFCSVSLDRWKKIRLQ